MNKFISILKLIRPKSWIKNLFVFSGVFFSSQFDQPDLLLKSSVIFLQFCLVSSAVYCLNDIRDRKPDALHPQKKHRPIPAGLVSVSEAYVLFGLFVILGFLPFLWIPEALPYLLGYLFLNTAYSFSLKNVALLDILIISAGFLLRILIGAYPLGIEASHWMLFCGFSLTFFISLSKRYMEYTVTFSRGIKARKVLEHYNLDFLKLVMGAFFAQTMIGYTLYIVESKSPLLFLTIFPALYGMLQYVLLITRESNRQDDPVAVIVGSREIIAAVGVWVLIFLVKFYA